MRAYQTALSKYRAGKYAHAAEAFRSFVSRYAKHAYTDNALYWLGECFYDMKNYRLALKIFRRVVEDHPTGNKAPDALLKMAYSYLKLKEKANAKTVLAQVVQSFPKSQVARLASQTLVKIQ
jgi:tol-pal system protein YbgF